MSRARYDEKRHSAQRWAAIHRHMLTVADPETLLDLGALHGYMASQAVLSFADVRVTAVELAWYERVPALGPRIDCVSAAWHAQDVLEHGPWSAALALSVLHHVPDWRATFDALLARTRWLYVELAEPGELLPLAQVDRAGRVAQIDAVLSRPEHLVLCQTAGYDPRFVRCLWAVRGDLP
jgi:hypothetical protein